MLIKPVAQDRQPHLSLRVVAVTVLCNIRITPQVDDPELLERSMERFFRWAEGSAIARELLGDNLMDVNGLELVQKPIETMSMICRFIGIECSADYLQACAKVVDPNPSITRNYLVWSKEHMNRIYSQIEQYPFLAHYTYED